jgi:hypothetical protein
MVSRIKQAWQGLEPAQKGGVVVTGVGVALLMVGIVGLALKPYWLKSAQIMTVVGGLSAAAGIFLVYCAKSVSAKDLHSGFELRSRPPKLRYVDPSHCVNARGGLKRSYAPPSQWDSTAQ